MTHSAHSIKPCLNILGAGRAARVVARWLADSGQVDIGQVANSSLGSAKAAVDFIRSGQAVEQITDLSSNDWLLIGLSDALLDRSKLHAVLCGPEFGQPDLAFHLSGSLTANVLSGTANTIASVHPARAFAIPELAIQNITGTWLTAEGDAEALAQLEPKFSATGARWQTIESSLKPLYHASTVIASNYLVTLTALARELAEAAGASSAAAQSLLANLQAGTLDNLDRTPAKQALTGPIERGDLATLKRFQQAISQTKPSSVTVLNKLGLATLDLAIKTRGAGRSDADIRKLFTNA